MHHARRMHVVMMRAFGLACLLLVLAPACADILGADFDVHASKSADANTTPASEPTDPGDPGPEPQHDASGASSDAGDSGSTSTSTSPTSTAKCSGKAQLCN